MRLGIMQPYFLPYLGYFLLIKHTDKFILFDTVQFIRHGWIERNRILKSNSEGWQYISVPLNKHEQKCIIKNISINNTMDWKQRILSQLVYYKKAPYYKKVITLLTDIFLYNYKDIVSLNKKGIETICDYLKITTSIEVFSDMHLEIDKVNSPDEWALNICSAIEGANEYWNAPGGISFFDTLKYNKAGIDIRFPKINTRPYAQFKNDFIDGLSIVDAMMFNSPDEINSMLDDYTFVY